MSTTTDPAVPPASAPVAASGRLASLDVYRGATIAAMVLVNDPGTWTAVYPPLLHSAWHGWTFTDLVFPSFLWIVGVSMTLSYSRRTERGDSRSELFLHALRRAAIIFALGLFINSFPFFHLSTLRIPGVLQRIAVCYLIGSAIFLWSSWRAQVAWVVGLLASYWMLMALVPVPGLGTGSLVKGANFAQYVDSLVLSGHMWAVTGNWDPEGIVSTLPSIATALFGVLTGHLLRTKRPAAEKAAWMFLAGNGLLVIGSIMNVWLPINKNLWTSSFSVFMAGISLSMFAACYWLLDVKGYRSWARPFTIFGMNAIAVYVVAELLAILLSVIPVAGGPTLQDFLFHTLFAPLAAPQLASLLWALSYDLFIFLFAWVLYRRKWFIKV